jgi:propionyl-CoA carboxylase alpha chain
VIELMGDKIAAIQQAKKAGTPTVPGGGGAISDPGTIKTVAGEIGYPVMLKAAAGGGGKGMRIAHSEANLDEAFRLATSEARSSFGDDRVFIEKYIERPRHIEIQVLGDNYGNIIHLGERECSIQRRHQKVIEESPSPFVSPEMRQQMGEAAVALGKQVGYSSAGTVEFIVDQKGNFYFLEMNTRLQVEHSVTEFVTEQDLVEWMLRVAYGEELTLTQDQVRWSGWAMESRIYAEDPHRGFVPSTGRIIRYSTPEEGPNIRVDNGVYEGGEVTLFYDPMIAKLTTWDRDRPRAIEGMRRALDEFYIAGVRHNIAFLTALMANRRFLEGDISTNFIAEEYPDGFSPAPLEQKDLDDIIAAATLMHLRYVYRARQISDQMEGYTRPITPDWEARIADDFHPITVAPAEGRGSEDGFDITVHDRLVAIRSGWQIGDPVLRCTINGAPRRFKVERHELAYTLYHLGAEVQVIIYRAEVAEMVRKMPKRKAPDMSRYLMSPMPGMLRSLAVEIGEKVNPGDELAVVEAMKMENLLRSERQGKIAKIHATPGDSLSVGQVILEYE